VKEFVQSVDQLLKVRLGTVHLKGKITDLNSEVQQAGSKIVEKVRAFQSYSQANPNLNEIQEKRYYRL
jgi:hypothetical protein